MINNTSIQDLIVISQNKYNDNRGSFTKFFNYDVFKDSGLLFDVKQVNISSNKNKGTIRGMHFQLPPFSETKIVSCIKGEVFDVAVDLRKNSPTFLKWHYEILSSKNSKSLLIPDGFAHGFQTLTNDCNLMYIHSGIYKKEFEMSISAFDSKISIKWPFKCSTMSNRDKSCKMIDDNFSGVLVK